MTIGELSRRTATPVKALRRYEQLGLIYTVGRSPANYRLFDESALWCTRVIHNLRALGLTMAEICELAGVYLERPELPIGPYLARRLVAVRARIDARMGELLDLRQRIEDFQASHAAQLGGQADADFRADDPRFRATGA
jgi:DNA-binding transcriptional MerR regulator